MAPKARRTMPELPEVELTRRNLERWLEGRQVMRAEADATRVFRGAKRGEFRRLRGRLVKASRKGKYLLLEFEGGRGLLLHLGMAGKLVRRGGGTLERFSRARLWLDDGTIVHLTDPRLFARVSSHPVAELRALPEIRLLGKDPLTEGLSAGELEALLGKSARPIKVALMDQSKVCGLGNLHAAEALFRARIHPERRAAGLSSVEWRRLRAALFRAIGFALRLEKGDELTYVEEPGAPRSPFWVYGRKGEPCRRCKGRVAAIAQGGRTTFFCPKCQPKGGKR